ncbi:ATP-binding protein [Stenoxybacter acetivorans]|uniref:ATP-binding protein n=1 Tax=Stenoxybacter acetivorans TaxID=422441 RepID=UPI001470868D|nr:ATP-binding protein [Stenoxybacter acetivorans]
MTSVATVQTDENSAYHNSILYKKIRADLSKLQHDADVAGNLLTTLSKGGQFKNKEGSTIEVQPLVQPKFKEELAQINESWHAYQQEINSIVNSDLSVEENGLIPVQTLIQSGRNQNAAFITFSSGLRIVFRLETEAVNKKQDQILAWSLGILILYFIGIILFVSRTLLKADKEINTAFQELTTSNKQLEQSYAELEKSENQLSVAKTEIEQSYTNLEEARRETTDIMETVNMGLFLLDSNLHIGAQHSTELENLFGRKSLSEQNFLNVLDDIAVDKTVLKNTQDYINQLYNEKVLEKLITYLNPLQQLEVYVPNPIHGTREQRYLNFRFKRVLHNKKIVSILVSVLDVTDTVILQMQLEDEKSQNASYLSMFDQAFKMERNQLEEYIGSTEDKIKKINDILKEEGSSQSDFDSKVNLIYRQVHSIKGESSMLGFKVMVSMAEKMEDILTELRKKNKLKGEDFLPLVSILDDLFKINRILIGMSQASTMSDLKTATQPISAAANNRQIGAPESNAAQNAAQKTDEIKINDFLNTLADFAKDISLRHSKKVMLNSDTFNHHVAETLSKKQFSAIKELSVQFLRNAIVHGIEVPSERVARNKPIISLINIGLSQNGNLITYRFADDGRGLDAAKIIQQALNQGLITEKQAQVISREDCYRLITRDGFSTASDTDEDAGRGVGMGVIQNNIDELGGKLTIKNNSTIGLGGTEFIVEFPLN